MTKLFAWLFAAALVIGLGSAPTLTYAEEDPIEEAEESGMDSDDSMKEDSMKEDSMKESDAEEEPQEDPIEEAEEGDE